MANNIEQEVIEMVNSIIIQHLKQNKRLVVPGFGAFIKKDDTGEVVFVEFLKKDDGVLATALQQGYSVDHKDAIEIINNYVVSAKQHILGKGNFIIDGLGTMHIDANSVYYFDYDTTVTSGSNTNNETTVTKRIETQIKEQKQEPVKANPITTPRPTQQQPQQQQPQQRPPARQLPQQPIAQQPIAQQPTQSQPPTQPQPTQQSKPQVSDHKKDEVIDVKGLQYQKPKKSVIPGQNKKKTDTVMLIAIIAATLAIIAMVYGLFTSSNPELTIDPSTKIQTVQTDSTTTK